MQLKQVEFKRHTPSILYFFYVALKKAFRSKNNSSKKKKKKKNLVYKLKAQNLKDRGI